MDLPRPGELSLPTKDVVRQETARALLKTELEERRARNSRYSMRAFARSVGLSQTQLSLILSGKRDVSLPQAMKLAQSLAPDCATFEKLLGISLLDLANSKRGERGTHPVSAENRPLSDDERIANLRRGIVIPSGEWPEYQVLIDQALKRASPETGASLVVKVFADSPARG